MTKKNMTAFPDYQAAITYALNRLRNELPPKLTYHSAWHTEHDVLPAAKYLGQLAAVTPTEQGLLEIGAAYHDIGHIHKSLGHEDISVDIMTQVLQELNFSAEDISCVKGLILATRMPQSPKTKLEQLIVDADMDGLGRSDFLKTSKALWQENIAMGRPQSWAQWLETQLHFLNAHRYFTAEARSLRAEGKQHNITMLEGLIRDVQDESK